MMQKVKEGDEKDNKSGHDTLEPRTKGEGVDNEGDYIEEEMVEQKPEQEDIKGPCWMIDLANTRF